MTDTLIHNRIGDNTVRIAVCALAAFVVFFALAPYAHAGLTPAISSATIKTSGTSSIVKVNFNYPVFTNATGAGVLTASDFTFTDASAGGVTIAWVNHTAGDDFAIVGLTGPACDGVSPCTTTDTISAYDNASIFTVGGNLKKSVVSITADATAPAITAVSFIASSAKQVLVTFSEPVYGTAPSNADNDGAIVEVADFAYTDVSAANAASITSLLQGVGSKYVRLTLNATTVAGDSVDTINAVATSIYDANGNAASAGNVFVLDNNVDERPRVSSITVGTDKKVIKVVFTEGVTDEAGNALAVGDITFWDNSSTGTETGTAFTTVTHTAGSTDVYLNFASAFQTAADGLEIVASKVMDGAGNFAATIAGAPGTAGSIALDGSPVPYTITSTSDTTAPTVTSITTGTDKKMAKVVFSEGVTLDTGAALSTAAFQVNDNNTQDQAVNAVAHTVGSDTATVYFAAAFDITQDMLEFEANKIVDVAGNVLSATEVKYSLMHSLATADTTAPTISAITHRAGTTKCVTVTFSEGVTDETGAAIDTNDIKFFDATASTAFTSVTHTAGSTDVFACHTAAITIDDEIEIVASKVADGAGNFAAATVADGSTVAAGSINAGTADTTAPTISQIFHNAGATKCVSVVFSEIVYDETGVALSNTDVKFFDATSSTAFATGVNHTAGETTVFACHSAAITSDDEIEIVVGKIQDKAGNFAAATVADGSTVAAGSINAGTLDNVAPVISGITHRGGTTKAAVVQFGEVVWGDNTADLGTANIKFFNETISTSFTSVVHKAGTASIRVFYTSSNLETTDEIEIVAAKVLDRAGNAAAATTADGTTLAQGSINAGTADITVPSITGLQVGTDKKIIKVTFNESLYDEAGNVLAIGDITLYDTSADGAETGVAFDTVTHAEAGSVVFLNLTAGFQTIADQLELVSTKITDGAGNAATAEKIGITTFITADTTAIVGTDITSLTAKTGGGIAVITFNQGVIDSDGTGLDVSDITVGDNAAPTTNVAAITHTAGSNVVVIQLNAFTWTITEDQIRFTTNITDLAGNAIASNIDSLVNAVTGFSAADATAPTVSSVSVSPDTKAVKVVFSEGVYLDTGAALSTASITFNDVSAGGTGTAPTTVIHTAGSATTVLYFSGAFQTSADILEFVDAKILDATGNAIGTGQADIAMAAGTNIVDRNQQVPSITSIQATKGSTLMLTIFSQPVFSGTDGTGALAASDLAYVDTTETTATVSFTHTAASTWLLLTRSAVVATADLANATADTLAAADATAVYDVSGIPAATTAVKITDTINPILVSASTMDVDADGLIDYYKLTLSEPIKESTVTGFATGAIGTTMGTEVVVGADGRYGTNAVLLDDTATVGGETNTDDDEILYIKFAQESNNATDIAQGDTDVTPRITTASVTTFGDFGSVQNTLTEVVDADLTEADTAKPAILLNTNATNPPKAIKGAAVLIVTFSEPVYTSNNGTGNLVKADFAYVDGGSGGVTAVHATTEASHIAGQRKATITMGGNFSSAATDLDDTIAAASATAIYDVKGNAAITTARNINIITGDATITLPAGWSVVSAPNTISDINFYNSGTGLTFYTLTAGTWASVAANTTNVTPLTGLMVNNTTGSTVDMYLSYATGVANNSQMKQKSLAAGWHLIGTAIGNSNGYDDAVNVLASLGITTGAKYSNAIDFTSDAFANGALTTSYAVRSGSSNWTQKSPTEVNADANVDMKDFMSYGIYMTGAGEYAGVTNN